MTDAASSPLSTGSRVVAELPDPPPAAEPLRFPLLAMLVPVVGAAALWALTGSTMMLWFAALGPLLALAGLGDRVWAERARRRRFRRQWQRAVAEAEASIVAAHDQERETAWREVAELQASLSGDGLLIPGKVLVGAGTSASRARITGGGSDPEAIGLRQLAQTLTDAPVLADLDRGIVVRGPRAARDAVMRALLLHACAAHPVGTLGLAGPLPRSFGWAETLPHRGVPAPRLIALVDHSGTALALLPEGGATHGAAHLVITDTPSSAEWSARWQLGEHQAPVVPRMLSQAQAEAAVRVIAARAGDVGVAEAPPLEVLIDRAAPATAAGLATPLGCGSAADITVDLVADGPHAVVVGVTGSGKSELLRSWVTGLCARYTPAQVVFLLADFKGGTAFQPLAALPHVTGVITDLDAETAARALGSLRAEVRRRERVLAEANCRDLADLEPGVLARLVIVVDEFAALVAAHADLAALFHDLAARGRALGMHLILGSQRGAGTFRDALLANCPLRISLRTGDSADSRLVMGTDAAVMLPGGTRGVGRALLRRASDTTAVPLSIARVSDAAIEVIAASESAPASVGPWLPSLPTDLPLPRVSGTEAAVRLGLADEPQEQRQREWCLPTGWRSLAIVGDPGSGRSSTLRLVAAQVGSGTAAVLGPDDLEALWDALVARQTRSGVGPLLVDRADEVIAALPGDYASEFARMLELAIRAATPDDPVVVAAARLGGATLRALDLVQHRALLAHRSRIDFLAHGGRSEQWSERMPPGRALVDGTLVQVYRMGPERGGPAAVFGAAVEPWVPGDPTLAWITRPGPRAEETARRWRAAGVRVELLDEHGGVGDTGGGGLVGRDGSPLVWRGDPDSWQRHPARLAELRRAGAVLVDAALVPELRLLVGYRGLPPYCRPDASRGWLWRPGEDLRRVVL